MEQIPSDHTQDNENVEPIVGNHSDISEHSDIDNNDIGGSGCDHVIQKPFQMEALLI